MSRVKTYVQASALYPPGWRYGGTLSNNSGDATNDIDIAAGNWIDSTNLINMTLTAMTKRLDANWAAGTNQGMRNSAAAITDTTYHIYAVCKAAGASLDYYAHTSATVATVITALQAEAGGADYLYARRIGSIIRAAGALKLFVQDDKTFTWKVPISNVAAVNPGTAALTTTLTVPAGIRVEAICTVMGYGIADGGAPGDIYLSDLSVTDSAPSYTIFSVAAYLYAASSVLQVGALVRVFTNTSAQVRMRMQISNANTAVYVNTCGWVDTYL
jgi:hypothetical protein